MKNPEADKAKRLAKACRSLEKASRGRDRGGARAEELRAKTVMAMSNLLDEFGLVDTAAEVAAKMVEFENLHTTVHLGSPKSLSVTLFVLKNGEIQLCARWRWGDQVELYRYDFDVREVQVFYKHMLLLLGYELPGSYSRELPPSQCLRFRPLPKSSEEPWILSSVPNGRKRRSLGIRLSQKRALELCHVLAEPLGWELES